MWIHWQLYKYHYYYLNYLNWNCFQSWVHLVFDGVASSRNLNKSYYFYYLNVNNPSNNHFYLRYLLYELFYNRFSWVLKYMRSIFSPWCVRKDHKVFYVEFANCENVSFLFPLFHDIDNYLLFAFVLRFFPFYLYLYQVLLFPRFLFFDSFLFIYICTKFFYFLDFFFFLALACDV